MCDGTEDGMLGLLECRPESWRWLNVRGATEVLDADPRDRVKPLKVHDFLVQSKSLVTTKQISSSAGAAVEA